MPRRRRRPWTSCSSSPSSPSSPSWTFLLLLLLLRLLAPALLLSLPVELGALLLALLLGAPELLVLLGGILVLLRGVLEDEGRELVPHVDVGDKAAGFALELDGVLLGDVDDRLGVAAAVALHEALDEALEVLREDLRGVRAVDDVRAALLVALGQRAELVAHVLGGVGGRAGESLGDVDHVGDVRLDAVTATLDLGLDRGHLVAVELVAGCRFRAGRRRGVSRWVEVRSSGSGLRGLGNRGRVGGFAAPGTHHWRRRC